MEYLRPPRGKHRLIDALAKNADHAHFKDLQGLSEKDIEPSQDIQESQPEPAEEKKAG